MCTSSIPARCTSESNPPLHIWSGACVSLQTIRSNEDLEQSNNNNTKHKHTGSSRRLVKRSSCSPLNSTKVSFGTVSVAEFQTVIGDNPEVHDGCPVALSPHPSHQIEEIPVQTYEFYKKQNEDKGRTRLYYWRLTHSDRQERLLQAGFSVQEIQQASQVAHQGRLCRERSIRQVQLDALHSVLEKTSRRLRKMLPLYGDGSRGSRKHHHHSDEEDSCI